MRNLIVTIIALAIVAGVLAKNPPASAPTLAASTAGLPRRAEQRMSAKMAEPARSIAATEYAAAADAPKAKDPVTIEPITEMASPTKGANAARPDTPTELVVRVRTEKSIGPVPVKASRRANPVDDKIVGSPVEPKAAILSSSPATREFSSAADTKQTIKFADLSPDEISIGNIALASRSTRPISTRNRSEIDILLSPEASAAQTLAVASALRFSAGLPTRKMLKERVAEINLKASSRASDRSAHAAASIPGSMNEMISNSIRSISEPLPASPIAEVRIAKRVKLDSNQHILAVAESIGHEPVKAIMPPMFAVVDTVKPPITAVVAPPKNAVFTINIDDKPQPALKNSAVAVMPVKVEALKVAPVKTAAPSAMKKSAAVGFSLNLQDGGYCDSNFVGPTITFAQTAELTLDDLLYQIHNRFGVNFLMGPEVGKRPVNIKSGSIPWNTLLRSQLFISGIRARCIDGNTVELIANSVLPSLQDMADVKTRFVKLKFLQRTGSGSVDLAGRSQGGGGQGGSQGGGCGGSGGQSGGGSSGSGGQGGQSGETAAQQTSSKFDKLIIEIEKIIGIRSMSESSVGGGGGGQGSTGQSTDERRTNRFVTQIPGRNILAIRATEDEHALIDEIIARADRPPFQVVIKGLVYTANQDKLRDIGIQTTITETAGRTGGGIFGHTIGGGGTLFDFSTIIGTFDFNVQATALQQNGVLSVKSRPFSTVLDGLCTRLNVGRSIPIVIDSTLGGQGSLEFVEALNKLEVTPHVIDDELGNPLAVTLELVMFANEVDTSVTTRGVPAVNERSIQTQLLLSQDKTAILGGFTLDSDQRSISKTPGLGDIPILGELFKRRVKTSLVNRLYFAISVSVIPYGEAIRPVDVPGVDTQPPSITPEMKTRSDNAEPKQVVGPGKTGP